MIGAVPARWHKEQQWPCCGADLTEGALERILSAALPQAWQIVVWLLRGTGLDSMRRLLYLAQYACSGQKQASRVSRAHLLLARVPYKAPGWLPAAAPWLLALPIRLSAQARQRVRTGKPGCSDCLGAVWGWGP